MPEPFAPDWLALREPHDAAARSRRLAGAFAAALPARPVVIDLGAGAGSLFRWLAPIIGGDQAWLLIDADPVLLQRAVTLTAAWAIDQGWRVGGGDGLTILAPGGVWRLATRQADLADLDDLPIGDADGIACTALLDLASAGWIAGLARRLRGPFLACLNVDGHDRWGPRHAADAAVRTGFRRDQARDKGLGPAVGHRAEAAMRAGLPPGWRLLAEPSPWRIPPGAAAMLEQLIEGHANAASARMPSARGAIAAWRRARLAQVATGRLSLTIGHRDMLALPPET